MSLWPEHAAWAETVLEFGEGLLAIDLREPASASARRVLATLGLDGPFAILTPCNPRGRLQDSRTNARLVAAAAARLASLGWVTVPVLGRSADHSHREQGWALAISRAEAIDLAREWEQQGSYWWDGAAFWIVLADGMDSALPVQAAE